MDILSVIQNMVSSAFKDNFQSDIAPANIPISLTKPEIKGDYTVTLFPFAKELRTNPNEMGNRMKDALSGKYPEISSIDVVGGFLNFSLSDTYWVDVLHTFNPSPKNEDIKQRFLIEFSSPNTNKPLHLGHVRNMLLGESITNILRELGHDVIKVQVINDRGIAICKSMLAFQLFGEGQTPTQAGIKGDHYVGNLYVLFENKFKEEYKQWQEGPVAGDLLEASKNPDDPGKFFADFKNQYFNTYSKLGLAARDLLNKWEAGDTETLNLWKMMNDWVYEGMNVTYENMGISFDKNYYESNAYLLGKEAVKIGLDRGIFTRDADGSVWIDLTEKGLDRKILLRSDGTSVYITQDIGLAIQRHEEHHFDKMVYVVADEQNYHFQVLFAILKEMGMDWADNLYHLAYGMVELPSGKMKSREGTVVDADDLMAEVIGEAAASGKERGGLASLSVDAQEQIYRKIGIGALKYQMIKVAARKKMIFDPKESVDMQGQTGPYIQNAYVRIQSILRRERFKGGQILDCNLEDQEVELIKGLSQYSVAINDSAATYDPSQLANYMYILAKNLHRYYHDVPILTAPDETIKQFRLYLIEKVAEVLEAGMRLLGIEMPERM